MISVGLIGFGYWGPNMARNVEESPQLKLAAIADLNPAAVKRACQRYPHIKGTTDPESIIRDPQIQAVIIATPVSTHFDLASKALTNGKHVLVEKPITDNAANAEALIGLAEKHGLVLMVDHTFIFSSAVQKIGELIKGGELGDILYYDSVRINLGLFQHDVNVIWDLAPHDISVMNYLMGKTPRTISAHGASFIDDQPESIAYVNLGFDDGFIAHFHLNWLAPVKIRQTVIGGSRKMLVYNDMEPTEKIKLYDKGVDVTSREGIYQTLIQYRTGDIYIPHLINQEPLRVEIAHFVECIQTGNKPITDGEAGYQVVRILEATQTSIKANGSPVSFN